MTHSTKIFRTHFYIAYNLSLSPYLSPRLSSSPLLLPYLIILFSSLVSPGNRFNIEKKAMEALSAKAKDME